MTFAQTAPGVNIDIPQLVQYGILGVIVVLLLLGQIRTKPDYERLLAEKDRAVAEKTKAETQRDEFIDFYNQKLMPMLTQFSANMDALLPVLQRLIDEQRKR